MNFGKRTILLFISSQFKCFTRNQVESSGDVQNEPLSKEMCKKGKQILHNAAMHYSDTVCMSCFTHHTYGFKHKLHKKTDKITVKC